MVKSPAVKKLRGIQITNCPDLKFSGGWEPNFSIFHCEGLKTTKLFQYKSDKKVKRYEPFVFVLPEEQQTFVMRGDTKISFCDSDKEKFRIMFNTSFIQNGNYIAAGKMQLSPEKIKKPKHKTKYHEDMMIFIFFDAACMECDPYKTELENLCPQCKEVLGDEILTQWTDVKKILSVHDYPSEEKGRALLPGITPEKIKAIEESKLLFNPDYYRIEAPTGGAKTSGELSQCNIEESKDEEVPEPWNEQPNLRKRGSSI